MAATTLTQPPDECQLCGYRSSRGDPLELDHMVELVVGGADAPYNLVRLCQQCHREKPFDPEIRDLLEYRWWILDWVRDGRSDWRHAG